VTADDASPSGADQSPMDSVRAGLGRARSAIATSLLQRAGFDNVTHMQGGFAAWEARGLPTVREDLGSAVRA